MNRFPRLSDLPARGLALALACCCGAARPDPGMWTFDHVPLQTLRDRHGVELTPAWLQHLQHAAVNFGASGSFVSPRGLMLTNHHVVMGCLQQLSTPQRDLVSRGYVAAAGAVDDAERNARRKAEIARQESACAAATGLQCEVTALYSGAVYQLYRYQQWDDVRLVFAPEYQAGNFGGDPDNFVYPRYALDAALVRVYRDGQPVRPPAHLTLARQPVAEGDVVFVAGHPGRTDRLRTLSQLRFLRDQQLPLQLATAEALQQVLHDHGRRSPEAARQAVEPLDDVENWLKSMRGEAQALADPALWAAKEAEESQFRAAYQRLGLAGDPWQDIDGVVRKAAARYTESWVLGSKAPSLLAHAGQLVDLAYERRRPGSQRLAAYRDAAIGQIERQVLADGPVHKDLEIAMAAAQFRQALQLLGPGHAYVRAVLAGDTPEAAAERLWRSSRLDRASERERLLKGGVAAVEASDDPLLRLARQTYALRREQRRFLEEEVGTPAQRAAAALGQGRFAVYGHSQPPDATGTLRLSFGKVAGYTSAGIAMPWKTTWGGWMARADSFDERPPFDLPPRVAQARGAVDPRTPLNFVTTADIVGGNSGSPVVNRRGEWVGLVFDGNLEGLGGSFAYSDQRARSIAVHAQAIVEALDKVYGVPALAAELRGDAVPQPASVK